MANIPAKECRKLSAAFYGDWKFAVKHGQNEVKMKDGTVMTTNELAQRAWHYANAAVLNQKREEVKNQKLRNNRTNVHSIGKGTGNSLKKPDTVSVIKSVVNKAGKVMENSVIPNPVTDIKAVASVAESLGRKVQEIMNQDIGSDTQEHIHGIHL